MNNFLVKDIILNNNVYDVLQILHRNGYQLGVLPNTIEKTGSLGIDVWVAYSAYNEDESCIYYQANQIISEYGYPICPECGEEILENQKFIELENDILVHINHT